jgi:hypothetical protein
MFFFILATICYFSPPAGWQPVRLDDPSSPIELAFVGSPLHAGGMPPNISLAFEEVDCTLKEYVQAVKETILAEAGVTWRDLGKISTPAGEARLTESSGISNWGPVKTLQLLFVKEHKAAILTATVLKEDFLALQSTLLQALKSLHCDPDVLSSIATHPYYQALTEQMNTVADPKQLEQLSKTLEKQFSEKGAYWHFLVLQEAHKKISKQK